MFTYRVVVDGRYRSNSYTKKSNVPIDIGHVIILREIPDKTFTVKTVKHCFSDAPAEVVIVQRD